MGKESSHKTKVSVNCKGHSVAAELKLVTGKLPAVQAQVIQN
jgi:hypothetical protein